MLHLPPSHLSFQSIQLHKWLVNILIEHFVGSFFQKYLQTPDVFFFSFLFSCSHHPTSLRITEGQQHRNQSPRTPQPSSLQTPAPSTLSLAARGGLTTPVATLTPSTRTISLLPQEYPNHSGSLGNKRRYNYIMPEPEVLRWLKF